MSLLLLTLFTSIFAPHLLLDAKAIIEAAAESGALRKLFLEGTSLNIQGILLGMDEGLDKLGSGDVCFPNRVYSLSRSQESPSAVKERHLRPLQG